MFLTRAAAGTTAERKKNKMDAKEKDEAVKKAGETGGGADAGAEKSEVFESAKSPDKEEPKGTTNKEDKKEKKACEKDLKKLRSNIARLETELEAAKAAAAEANDKYLRICAEYDNFRKRSQKERDGIYADASADSVKELLPIFDNLERATQFTAPDKVAEGVQMILSSLPAVFEKMKIVPFGEAGETFDPTIHNAVMHVEDESLGDGVITDVFQKGYKIGDKVVRYAMVKVAN